MCPSPNQFVVLCTERVSWNEPLYVVASCAAAHDYTPLAAIRFTIAVDGTLYPTPHPHPSPFTPSFPSFVCSNIPSPAEPCNLTTLPPPHQSPQLRLCMLYTKSLFSLKKTMIVYHLTKICPVVCVCAFLYCLSTGAFLLTLY